MVCTEKFYIESATSLLERIARIDAIILALEGQLLTATSNSDIISYNLDDGQVKIQTQYRSIAEINRGIEGLDALRQRLINQLNGRQRVLRPWQGLR